MNKRKLLKALRVVKLGDSITVRGHRHQVDEVCDYEQDGEKWKNLVYHTCVTGGTEVALEIEGGKLRLWVEASELRGKFTRPPRILEIEGEKAKPVEYRQKAKMTVTNKDGTEELDVVYSVYKMDENIRWALEDWGEGIYVYVSQGQVAPEEVQV